MQTVKIIDSKFNPKLTLTLNKDWSDGIGTGFAAHQLSAPLESRETTDISAVPDLI